MGRELARTAPMSSQQRKPGRRQIKGPDFTEGSVRPSRGNWNGYGQMPFSTLLAVFIFACGCLAWVLTHAW